ncbi:type 3 dihydrofolate reductase [Candidatus Pantoea edessiphila]|uniref:Dihydrofolate reductase n=1 Tax=Candidatus Pantoea edessiphila TaxID=2044610 RepID=A0A2P5T216_9GAMM|nr:type 3 dihydrofolate reductase [Candidatus Pantoea edessiphila]PPI88635.1 type 3 dihydrofolate reductase [Candidatus Pantoea edessiphila]
MISIIASFEDNRFIGLKNNMLWNLPVDLLWFKKNTINKPIIMGRITFESIGRALPQRTNIVVSSNPGTSKDVIWVKSLNEAIKLTISYNETMIIGGASIYEQMINYADLLYLTHVNVDIFGDKKFPYYNPYEWKPIFRNFHNIDKKNIYSCNFEILRRRFKLY